MPPVPRPGRTKITTFQHRRQRKKPLSFSADCPEDIADVVGSIDYWLQLIKLFRWHDEQLDVHPDHALTRRGIASLLSMDSGQIFRWLRKHNIKGQTSKDVFPWQDLRWPIAQKLVKASVQEILDLSFVARSQLTTR